MRLRDLVPGVQRQRLVRSRRPLSPPVFPHARSRWGGGRPRKGVHGLRGRGQASGALRAAGPGPRAPESGPKGLGPSAPKGDALGPQPRRALCSRKLSNQTSCLCEEASPPDLAAWLCSFSPRRTPAVVFRGSLRARGVFPRPWGPQRLVPGLPAVWVNKGRAPPPGGPTAADWGPPALTLRSVAAHTPSGSFSTRGTGPPWRGSAMGRPWESVRVTARGARALPAAESTTSTQGEEAGFTQTQESFPALRQGLGRTLSAQPRPQSPRQRGPEHAARKDLGEPAGDATALVTEGGPSGTLSKSPFPSGQVPGPPGSKVKREHPQQKGPLWRSGPGWQGGSEGAPEQGPSRAEAPRDARAESSRVDGLRSMEAPRSTGTARLG